MPDPTAPSVACDLAVLGGGLAGLSLVAHLRAAGVGSHVVLVDDGRHPVRDRTWAYWSTGEGLLDAAAGHGVDEVWVRGQGWEHRLALAPYAYRSLSGASLDRLAAPDGPSGPRVTRLTGHVTAVRDDATGARVEVTTADGPLAVTARYAFDSVRPAPPAEPHLDFVGLHVVCDRDVFDPAPTLMDFRTGQEAGAAFVYVLPTGPRAALVERTRYVVPGGRGADRAPEHEAGVRTYLADVLQVRDARVVGRESGVIPLRTSPPPRPGPSVVPIGTAAGMVRASTGYGVGRVQRHSAALADSLARHGHPWAARRPGNAWYRGLDRALLDLAAQDPAVLLDVLARMLGRNPGDRVVAFLDDALPAAQQLRLFATLPLPAFALAVLRRHARGPARVSPPAPPAVLRP